MTISKDLFLSILSMDAYNRGYGAGIDGLGGLGSGIGTASVGEDAQQLLSSGSAFAADFYAIAYNDPTYGTIISYRGTDNQNYLTGELTSVDLPISFGGSYEQAQVALAQKYLDAVDSSTADLTLQPGCFGHVHTFGKRVVRPVSSGTHPRLPAKRPAEAQ